MIRIPRGHQRMQIMLLQCPRNLPGLRQLHRNPRYLVRSSLSRPSSPPDLVQLRVQLRYRSTQSANTMSKITPMTVLPAWGETYWVCSDPTLIPPQLRYPLFPSHLSLCHQSAWQIEGLSSNGLQISGRVAQHLWPLKPRIGRIERFL